MSGNNPHNTPLAKRCISPGHIGRDFQSSSVVKGASMPVQGRALGRSEGLGWGWASPAEMKIGRKEAAMWAGRQAEVKEVRIRVACQCSQ